MTKCRLACLSTRKLILPPLMSDTALATSGVTVPVLGFGIRPRGPSTRAILPTLAIWSGVAIAASKSRKPPWIFSIRSSLRTMSAPAAVACSALSPTANTATRAVLPVPCGRFTVPRTIWSALRGSTPSRIATSTVASCFLDDVSLASFAASSGVYSRSRSTFSAASRYALLFLLIDLPIVLLESWFAGRCQPSHAFRGLLLLDRDAHRPGGAGDDLGRLIDVVGVQVFLLGLRDLAHLIPGHLGDLDLVRLARALLHPCGLQQQLGCGRGLQREREAAVLVDGDLHGDDVAALRLGRGVVRLAELHDVDAVLAERRTDRRGGGGRTGVDLELDDRGQPLPGGHVFLLSLQNRSGRTAQILLTWLNDSST